MRFVSLARSFGLAVVSALLACSSNPSAPVTPAASDDAGAAPDACTPKTCGASCGAQLDGCGATLDCGLCAIHVDGQRFADAAGRTIVLRGVNVAGNAKVPPFRVVTSPTFFDPVAAMGHDVVRLLFLWEAYEGTRGTYDESYLDAYASAVDAAASRGIHVVVDFHQDGFSRFTLAGCGDGMPSWAVPSSVTPATPANGATCTNWGTSMLYDSGMKTAWASFYANENKVRDSYLAMVGHVAQRLSSHPGVAGYDLLNEPWGDEATDIHALYEDAAKSIRAGAPSAILFLSPNAVTSAGQKSSLPAPTFANFAFAQHFYDANVFVSGAWSGTSLDPKFVNIRSVADAWGAPLFLGEFGDPPSVGNVAGYIGAIWDELDTTLASGAQWAYTPGWTAAAKDGWNMEDFSIVDDTGATRANYVPRPYPRAIAGKATEFALTGASAADRVVQLAWTHDPSLGTTELFVPMQALFGTASPTVETTGAQLGCAVRADQVLCASSASGAMQVRIHAP